MWPQDMKWANAIGKNDDNRHAWHSVPSVWKNELPVKHNKEGFGNG